MNDGCLCQPELIVTGAALGQADAWRELTLWRKVRRTVIAERELGLGACGRNFAHLIKIEQIRLRCAQCSAHRRLVIADDRLETFCHQHRIGPILTRLDASSLARPLSML